MCVQSLSLTSNPERETRSTIRWGSLYQKAMKRRVTQRGSSVPERVQGTSCPQMKSVSGTHTLMRVARGTCRTAGLSLSTAKQTGSFETIQERIEAVLEIYNDVKLMPEKNRSLDSCSKGVGRFSRHTIWTREARICPSSPSLPVLFSPMPWPASAA